MRRSDKAGEAAAEPMQTRPEVPEEHLLPGRVQKAATAFITTRSLEPNRNREAEVAEVAQQPSPRRRVFRRADYLLLQPAAAALAAAGTPHRQVTVVTEDSHWEPGHIRVLVVEAMGKRGRRLVVDPASVEVPEQRLRQEAVAMVAARRALARRGVVAMAARAATATTASKAGTVVVAAAEEEGSGGAAAEKAAAARGSQNPETVVVAAVAAQM